MSVIEKNSPIINAKLETLLKGLQTQMELASPEEQIEMIAKLTGESATKVQEDLVGSDLLKADLQNLVENANEVRKFMTATQKSFNKVYARTEAVEADAKFFKILDEIKRIYYSWGRENLKRSVGGALWDYLRLQTLAELQYIIGFLKAFDKTSSLIGKSLAKTDHEDFYTDRTGMDYAPNLLLFGGKEAYEAALEGKITSLKEAQTYTGPMDVREESGIALEIQNYILERLPGLCRIDPEYGSTQLVKELLDVEA